MPYEGTYHFAHFVCSMHTRPRGEQLVYHHDLLRFHTRLVDAAKKWARAFRASYDGAFKKAAYGELLSRIDESEASIAHELFKNGRGGDDVVWQIINFRMYRQIQAIAKGEGSLQGIDAWVGLFNDYMQCGTAPASRKGSVSPTLRVRFGEAEAFARYFLAHVTATLRNEKPCAALFDHMTGPMDTFVEVHRNTERFDPGAGEQFLEWVRMYDSLMCRETEVP